MAGVVGVRLAGEATDPAAQIPHLHQPQDALRHGLHHVKDLTTSAHPLEGVVKNYVKSKAEEQKNFLRVTQGTHAAMRINMENAILSQYRRLPGFHSEMVGLGIMNQEDDVVGVEDILNDPREHMEMPVDLHEGMECRLGFLAHPEQFHAPAMVRRPMF